MVGVEGVKDVREVAREPARCTGAVQEKGACGLAGVDGSRERGVEGAIKHGETCQGLLVGGDGWRSEKQQ